MVEKDPNGKNQHEGGSKLDAGKAPLFKGVLDYFPRAIKAVAEVSAFGAEKYVWKGWQTVPDGYARYTDALLRHIADGVIEGPYTADSWLLHDAHVAWNALARLELRLRENKVAGTIPTSDKPVDGSLAGMVERLSGAPTFKELRNGK